MGCKGGYCLPLLLHILRVGLEFITMAERISMKKNITPRGKVNYSVRKRKSALFSLCLLIPAIVLCTAFILLPIINTVWMSFTEYKIKNLTKNIPGEWNQFQNYIRLFSSGKIQDAVGITLKFVIITVILTFFISLVLALILNSEIPGARIFRSLMMIPWVIPTVIAGLVWAWIYANPYGILQYVVQVLSKGSIVGFGMLSNQSTALWGVIVAALWKQVPLMALLLLAGMQNVSEDLIEAARIDGANYTACVYHVILPSIKPVIIVTLSMCIIENFKQYPLFATLTNGGPAGATTTLAVLSYDEAFTNYNYGSGAAVTTIWLLLMIIVVFVFQCLSGKRESEDM